MLNERPGGGRFDPPPPTVVGLKAVKTSFPKGSIFDMPDASQRKQLCR